MLFLFPGNGLRRAFARARIGVGPLTTNRQPAPVTQTPVTAQIHQPFDVHGRGAAQIAFYQMVLINSFTNPDYF